MMDLEHSVITSRVSYDEGLRVYLLGVFKNMFYALAITFGVAYLASNSIALMRAIHTTPLGLVVALAPLGFVFYFNAKIERSTSDEARNMLFIFSALMGLSLSYIFLAYAKITITRALLVTTCTFGAMVLYGNSTKKDLTGMGSFLMMGLLGIILASVINLFIGSTQTDLLISYAAVVIFTGLTAYDIQRIKNTYSYMDGNKDMIAKVSVRGALSLYLDFINLFISLLRIMGSQRD